MTDDQIADLEECSQMFDFTGFTPEEDKQLLAEVKRLRTALRKFGRHPYGCPQWAGPEYNCTCGLDVALETAS